MRARETGGGKAMLITVPPFGSEWRAYIASIALFKQNQVS